MRVLDVFAGNGFSETPAPWQESLVSVIIPSFNHEDFVSDAIASVIRQTYRPLEVLFIDDASRDRTFEVGVAQLRESLLPFLAVKKENQGSPVAAINAGIGLSHGEYICLLASDDVYCRQKVEASVEVLRSSGADLVVGRVKRISLSGEGIDGSETTLEGLRTWYEKGRLLEGMFVGKDQVAMPYLGIVFRREIFDRIGYFDPTFLTEDLEMALRIAATGARLAFIDQIVGLHRFINKGEEYSLRIARDCERVARRYAPSARALARALAYSKLGQSLALRRTQRMRAARLALGGVLWYPPVALQLLGQKAAGLLRRRPR